MSLDSFGNAMNETNDLAEAAIMHAGDADAFGDDHQESGESMESLMDMYEESFKRFAEGEVVTGKIISVDKDYVLVDIGYKSEGQIRIQEFKDENGDLTAKVDDLLRLWWNGGMKKKKLLSCQKKKLPRSRYGMKLKTLMTKMELLKV